MYEKKKTSFINTIYEMVLGSKGLKPVITWNATPSQWMMMVPFKEWSLCKWIFFFSWLYCVKLALSMLMNIMIIKFARYQEHLILKYCSFETLKNVFCILSGTIVIRLCMFPIVVLAQRNAAHMSNHMPTIARLQQQFSEARMSGNPMEGIIFNFLTS